MILSRRDVLTGAAALALSPATGKATPPADPGDWLRRWLAAFNDADASAYPAFVRRHIPGLIPFLDEDLGVREASGGFNLMRREDSGLRETTAWLRDRNWDRFSKAVLTIGDAGIDDLSFAGAPDPAGFSIRRMGEQSALRALQAKIRTEAASGRMSGAVLVARDDRILLRQAFGDQDAAGTRLITADTRFCIGSAGKMFTAVAVLQLIQQGRLRLSDTLASRLPDYPDTALARTVTVRHLLTHTGGTGDFFGPEYEAHAAQLRTPSDLVRHFGQREAAFPVGTRWGYSNFGFILLGAILEQATGARWDDHIQRAIFDVAGMVATSPIASADTTAVPLSGAAQTGLKPLPYYVGLPAGGGYSTVDDLYRFAVALRRGTLLDPEHLRLLTSPSVSAGSGAWSLGLRLAARTGATSYGHRGSAPGVSADFAVYPGSGYIVIALCNRGHPHALNIADYIGSRLPLDRPEAA
jgi:D-alanyl-D-alanine carboxypeptidase